MSYIKKYTQGFICGIMISIFDVIKHGDWNEEVGHLYTSVTSASIYFIKKYMYAYGRIVRAYM